MAAFRSDAPRALWPGLAVILAACGPTAGRDAGIDVCDATSSAGMELEVGAGESRFTAVREGEPLAIIHGPQGGAHLWTAVRVRGATEPTEIRLAVRSPDGAQQHGPLSFVIVTLGPEDASGWRERAGLFNFLDDPEAAEGQTVALWARVGDCSRAIEGQAVGVAE